MVEAILPADVSVATARVDILGAAPLPAEEAAVERAVESRRREFATTRVCARAALERWGLSRRAIPMGPDGAPRWPAGIVGSITHCDGYRACAVARDEDLMAIGIDAEPNEPLPKAVLLDIAAAGERAWVRQLRSHAPLVHWDRLLFCMKEAVYKTWFPLTERRLDFEDAIMSVAPSSGSFTARLRVPGPPVDGAVPTELAGRWSARDGILMTAIALPTGAVER